MGQHPNPDPDKDEEDLEDLGTPFYQGNGLSVRALSAEEFQQFLDAHADQPIELLGSGWAALDRPAHPFGVLRAPSGAEEPAPPQPQPVLPAQQATVSLGYPGRSALTPVPAPSRRRAGRLDPQPDLAGTPCDGRRPGRRRPGRPGRPTRDRADRPDGGRPGRLAAAVLPLGAGPRLAVRRPRGTADRPAVGAPRPRRLRHLP